MFLQLSRKNFPCLKRSCSVCKVTQIIIRLAADHCLVSNLATINVSQIFLPEPQETCFSFWLTGRVLQFYFPVIWLLLVAEAGILSKIVRNSDLFKAVNNSQWSVIFFLYQSFLKNHQILFTYNMNVSL